MRVVHLSTSDIVGGAALSAYRLHQALQALGHDSRLFVDRAKSDDPTVTVVKPPKGTVSRALRALRRAKIRRDLERYTVPGPGSYEIFTHDRSRYGGDLAALLPDSDVI